MRLRIRTKLSLIVFLILSGAISAVLWKTSEIFWQDKTDFVKQLTNKLSASSARLVSDRLKDLQNQMALFVSTRESLGRLRDKNKNFDTVLFERFENFSAVALVKKENETWKNVWVETNPGVDPKEWTKNYQNTLIKSIPFGDISPTGRYFTNISVEDKEAVFSLSFQIQLTQENSDNSSSKSPMILVGFLNKKSFSDIVLDYKADLNNILLVDLKGYVYAHPNEDNIGKSFREHTLVNEIVSKSKNSGTGIYLDIQKNKLFGSYINIENSNLYVVATTPEKQAFLAAQELAANVIIFGIAFLLIGLSVAFAFSSKITNPLLELQKSAAEIGKGNFKVAVNVSSKDEVGDLSKSIEMMKKGLLERDEQLDAQKQALIQSEKMSAFGQLSAGIAHEVKNPLAGILGHAQLGKTKSSDENLRKHFDVIEKETRRTKEIIENLMKFARAEKAELIPTDLHQTLSATVDLVDHQLSLMGVKIVKKLSKAPLVSANSNQLQQVLLNIMMNAGHAMEKSEEKTLTVFLEKAGDLTRIRIQDTGSGIPPEVQKRIFEPFFTTKPAGKGTGLGLSVSFGIIRDHNGKIYIESEMGKGTTFFIDLPSLKGDVQVVESAPESESPVESVVTELTAQDLPEIQMKPQSSKDNIEVTTPSHQIVALKADENRENLMSENSVKEELKIETQNESSDIVLDKSGTSLGNPLSGKQAEALPDVKNKKEKSFKVKIRKPKMKG